MTRPNRSHDATLTRHVVCDAGGDQAAEGGGATQGEGAGADAEAGRRDRPNQTQHQTGEDHQRSFERSPALATKSRQVISPNAKRLLRVAASGTRAAAVHKNVNSDVHTVEQNVPSLGSRVKEDEGK